MGKIGTKNVNVGSGKLPKNFIVGNQTARIIGMSFQETTFKDRNTGSDVTKAWVVMDLETEAVGGEFEGWLIDKNDESKGRRSGQTGRVKSDPFGYEDKTYNGKDYSIHKSTIQFLKGVELEATGATKFMDDIDGKYDTYDEICKAFAEESGVGKVFLNWCIGGKKEMGDDGYPVYWMNLPKWTKGSKLYAHPDKSDNLLQYHAGAHLFDKTGGATPPPAAPAGATSNPASAPAFNPAEEEDDPFKNAPEDDPFATSEDLKEDPFATSEE
jgi:hypothetical protein